jgi:hypothetical protein
MFGERGDPQKIDIPDYDFGGPVMKAAPVLDQKGEVISIDFGYYWRYRPGELGTNRQPY